jgi:hypothetical protein
MAERLDFHIKEALDEAGVKRRRPRRSTLRINRQEIFERVENFYTMDETDRADFIEDRLQRYAKYRMWYERMDLPWSEASDIPMPDMMTDSLRMQDTLHNAVMSQTPPIGSKALNKDDKEKEETVDNLLHHQMFNDNDGDTMIGEIAENFVNDGYFVVYNPWVKQKSKIVETRTHDPIPDELLPRQYFEQLLKFEFAQRAATATEIDQDGWDWELPEVDEQPTKVRFYTTEKDKVEMVIEKIEEVFNGPKPMVMDVDDVLFPWRASNLQPPGPSNPNGASHVILRDFPTIDEIAQLQKRGYYNLISKKQVEDIKLHNRKTTYERPKTQKDDFQGTYDTDRHKNSDAPSHNRLTRLICFDRYDIDGDGLDEDVIFWVLCEPKLALKVMLLTDVFPSNPPMRPLVTESFIPVKGRVIGISLLEMMEGLHDATKELVDQTIDSGTLSSSPFFFYKPASTLNPEIITMNPGEGIPIGMPKEDIYFPQLNTNGQTFGINMMTILGQMQERLTMTSDLQRGQIPEGKSSALRTVGGMQAVLAQGEARPERILRRFFKGLSQLYTQTHEMNQRLLPKDKKVLITKNLDPSEDPYQTVSDKSSIRGKFQFRFSANILNTSKAAMQQALQSIMNVAISQLSLQMGLIDQEGIYRLMRDFVKAWGQDPNDYFKKPSPTADLQLISGEQALISILNGVMPGGIPANGWIKHLDEINGYISQPEFAAVENKHLELLRQYLTIVSQHAQQEQETQQRLEAARRFQQQQQIQQGGGQQGGQQPNLQRQQLSPNETFQAQEGGQ